MYNVVTVALYTRNYRGIVDKFEFFSILIKKYIKKIISIFRINSFFYVTYLQNNKQIL